MVRGIGMVLRRCIARRDRGMRMWCCCCLVMALMPRCRMRWGGRPETGRLGGKLRVLDFEPPPEGFAQTVYYLDHLDAARTSMAPGVVVQTLTASRPMWIDAISINQEDTQERNSQVAIMSEIYSRGMRCGWLLGRARRL